MAWEGVPWMVNGGDHTAEIGRMLANAATGGGEGVAAPEDCKVVASAIPDGNVHIQPGALGMINRFPGGASQSYLSRNVGDEAVALTPQGSAGERYDLICVIVEDPEYAGQPAPADPALGPYVRSAVYEGVPANTRHLWEVDPDQTGYALARVKFNASDGTVNEADITDLRELIAPRVIQFKRLMNPAVEDLVIGDNYDVYPTGAEWDVEVPTWATRVQLEAHWSGISMRDDGADGGTWFGKARALLGTLLTQETNFIQNAVGPGRYTTVSTMCAGEMAVPVAMRGTTQHMSAQLRKTGGGGMTGRSTQYTTCVVTATFYEVAGDPLV